ncbi:MAG: ABC transporter substrate-binding protein [Desulfomonile tiedjei]|uniref:ABC transporter substrate-binding protein n=1 Tax=Desulfomonile tiedjei TaxID=2358 RepID=A0A9D6V895_9BACT|nr:ABC transporter substrate-binding protein [Desulfomonile tiedjei]
MRKSSSIMLAAIVACLLFSQVALGADREKMKLVYASYLDFCMDVPIAIEKGYFGQVGLDLEAVDISSVATRISLLPKEDIDGCFMASSTALFLVEKGLDLVLVCGIGNRSFDYAVLKDSPIKDIKDFGGKKIANLAKPSNPWLALEYDLTANGVKGYTVIATADDADRTSMLLSGNVDVAMSSPAMECKLGDQIRVVHCCTTSKYLWNSCGWFFKRDYIKKHPEAIQKFVQGLAMSRKIINGDPEEAIKIYSKYNKMDQTTYKKPFQLPSFDSPPVIYIYGLEETHRIMQQFNLLKTKIEIGNHVNGQFAKPLDARY